MHLLFYIHSLAAGGAERVMVKLANELVQDHNLTLVTQTAIGNEHYPLDPKVVRISLDAATPSHSVFSAFTGNWHRIQRLRQVVKRKQPDRILTFMPTANVVGVLATLGLDIPVVISERVHPPFASVSNVRRQLQKYAYPRAECTVVLAEQSADYLREEFNLTRLAVIPNGVALPLPRSQPTKEPDEVLAPHQRLVLFVGRMTAQKQPLLALQAFASAIQATEDAWHLVMIGDGDMSAEVDAQIAAQSPLPNNSAISHLTRVGNVQDWYERAAIFLSTSAYEGSPNALMEAMACGAAVIALDCPTGPRDLIEHEKNGCLLPLAAQAEVGASLERLMVNEALRASFATQAREVTQTFSDERFLQSWRQVLGLADQPLGETL